MKVSHAAWLHQRLIHIMSGKLICCGKHPPEEQQEALVSQVGQSWFQLDESVEVGLRTSTNITSQTNTINLMSLPFITLTFLHCLCQYTCLGFFTVWGMKKKMYQKYLNLTTEACVFLKQSPCPHRPRPVYPGPPWTQPCCGRGAVWPAAPCPSCWRTPRLHAAARGDVWWHTTCTSAQLDKEHCGMKEGTFRCLWNCRCRDNAV